MRVHRRLHVTAAVVVVAALVAAVVLTVRWQHSPGHRAGEYADSFRDLPGVTSVQVTGAGHEPRDFAIHLAPTAHRAQLDDVYDRLSDLPDDVVDDISVTLGAVTVTASGQADDSEDVQWALRRFEDSTVQIDDAAGEIEVRSDERPAVIAAREAAIVLDGRAAHDTFGWHVISPRSAVAISDDLDLAVARDALDDLAPLASSIRDASITTTGVRIQLTTGSAASSTRVITAARHAATRIDTAEADQDVSFTVEGPGGAPHLSGDPRTDPGSARAVADQLRRDGWTVRGIETDLSSVVVAERSVRIAHLATLRRDVAALHPRLPANAVITLQDSGPSRFRAVFGGTQADLASVPSGLVSLQHDGYRVLWGRDLSSARLLVDLPEHAVLGAAALRTLAPRLRALGWRGPAQLVIREHSADGRYHYGDASVTITSTATGRASDVQLIAGPGTELSQLSATRVRSIWDAGAGA